MRKSLATVLLVAIATIPPLAASADPVTIAWTPVGNPGNAADPGTGSLYGAVDYSYNIGTYDVTVSQYVTFLNSNDPTGANALGLYNSNMSDPSQNGEINYNPSGTDGSLYSAVPGDENLPIVNVSFYDTLRFANWLNNGQAPGSTETGAYTLLGVSDGNSITRNADATVFLPNENEWYKAAFYNPATSSYYQYATASDTIPTASAPTGAPNSANYDGVLGTLTDVGAYAGTTSPYGAYDMAGDVFNWNETLIGDSNRGLRGSSYNADPGYLPSSERYSTAYPPYSYSNVGFRVASIATAEPSTGALALIACGVILWWRKRFK